ncbi:MAG: AAA family ATPase, partial [Ktedonobacteraceae bacterium]|nr:AAA family ATPase [Ktedonobacteraceae bacterium]
DIAKRLERFGAVLVQGPPGTGKTHTIANLVGHLLAQGKSVLVTSHTSKALKVLREKVVEPLQPLCVSILEDDSREEMERAIDTITERLSFTNAGTLEREAAKLTQQRIDLLATLQHTRGQLKEARQSEYREIVLNGRTYTPSEAARYVAQQSAACDWLPAPLIPDTPLLLSPQELVSLYQTNVTVTGQDEREMAVGLPDPQKLASPVDVEQWAAEREHLLQEHLDFRPDLWITAPDHVPVEELKQLEHRLVQALEPLKENGDDRRWRLAVIADGRQGGVARQVWDDLITKIKQVENLALQAQPLSLEYDLVLPDSLVSSHTEQVLSEILKQVERSGHLNGLALLLHRDWKTLLEQAQVNGQRPETREHFLALLMYIRLMIARKDLAGRWQRQMAVLGAPDAAQLGSAPERICRQYLHQLHQCLHWFPEIWEPLEQELRHQGLQWDTVLAEMPVNLAEHGELLRLCDAVQERLPPMLAAEKSRRLYQANEARFHDLQCLLELHNSNHASADVVQRLHSAVSNHDAKAYREAFMRLVDLYEKQHALRQRQDLLSKLEQCAPGWANAIHHREGIHGEHVLPGDPQEAWHWRQLQEALECRSSASLAALQERCIQLSDHLHRMTAELVEKKAWAAQVCRTTPVQRRALQGWKELMRKVGKGTGKRAATLLAEARRLMPECQTAVPVWIMPLSRVVQNFDPRTNRFDVVIIDEASQADIKALAAIYMGHQIVVVGDDEQVTPVDVGQKLEQVDKLMNEHLQNIPLAKLYDGRLSIYALAKTASFELVYLQEHFRCVAPIIRFSNVLSYEGKIKPLRDDSDVKRRPATVAYRVQAFESNGQTNEPEAQAITSLLIAATEQPEYRDATFGVISMVSDRQALHIESLLRQYLPIAEYTRRHILCGNPAHFQGDERDIIFLSMVDTPKGDGPLPFRSEDAFEYLYKKRFNVAASRARDQLWVVHSLDPRVDLKDGDIRKRLILHAQNPTYALSKLAEQEQRAESEFEKQVLRRLTQAGYRVISQWPVGAYRLDLVVEDNGRRLAVECDGDRWHPIEKLEEDVARQIVLERLGWRFARIRGSHFFRNPEQALAPVFARLRELDIAPMSNGTMEHASSQGETELYKRITHRAAELRMQWSAPTKRPAVSTRAASMINRPS